MFECFLCNKRATPLSEGEFGLLLAQRS